MGRLTAHAAHHIQQFQQFKESDYTDERDTWTGMKAHNLGGGRYPTTGLAAQFPNKF